MKGWDGTGGDRLLDVSIWDSTCLWDDGVENIECGCAVATNEQTTTSERPEDVMVGGIDDL